MNIQNCVELDEPKVGSKKAGQGAKMKGLRRKQDSNLRPQRGGDVSPCRVSPYTRAKGFESPGVGHCPIPTSFESELRYTRARVMIKEI